MYRGIFPVFYDFSDASIYDLNTDVSGITFNSLIPDSKVHHFPFTGLDPHVTFPTLTQAKIVEGGLRLQNQTISFVLNSGWNFTICVVMQIWLKKTNVNTQITVVRHNLIYDKTNSTLKLQTYITTATPASETSITLPSTFNSKRVVLWLTKYGSQYGTPVGSLGTPTVKASISNYSSTLTLPTSLVAQGSYTFKIFSEDAYVHKIMYTPFFYDFDSAQFHKIMVQRN